MNNSFSWSLPYASQKAPILARNIVATSQPLAAQAGLQMLRQGGNAVDAALATAITLTVVEPVMNGIGGDMFAQIWHEGKLYGLSASGHAPLSWHGDLFSGLDRMPGEGWLSVTVPAQVRGWAALHQRFGQLPFARLFEPAIDYAEHGFEVPLVIAGIWNQQVQRLKGQPGFDAAFLLHGEAPKPGDFWRYPEQATTLREIAQSYGESFYTGQLSQQILDYCEQTGGYFNAQDLVNAKAEWVEPIALDFHSSTLHEIPPNGQGIAALIALGVAKHFDWSSIELDSADFYHLGIECIRVAFHELHQHIADPSYMQVSPEQLLQPLYLEKLAQKISIRQASCSTASGPKEGGTVYLCAADAKGTMVSYIQSNFNGFGSGVVMPHTGIAFHNRGSGFSTNPQHVNYVRPGKKPLHTIIPGFITSQQQPIAAFGVMGGTMQAQGHFQMMLRHALYKQNPQAMSDAPRFRVEHNSSEVFLEAHTPVAVVAGLRELGHQVKVAERNSLDFGSAQLIFKTAHGYLGASDSRRDGQAVGF